MPAVGRKVEMSSVDLSFGLCAFEVSVECSGGGIQQAAGCIVEPHIISICSARKSNHMSLAYANLPRVISICSICKYNYTVSK